MPALGLSLPSGGDRKQGVDRGQVLGGGSSVLGWDSRLLGPDKDIQSPNKDSDILDEESSVLGWDSRLLGFHDNDSQSPYMDSDVLADDSLVLGWDSGLLGPDNLVPDKDFSVLAEEDRRGDGAGDYVLRQDRNVFGGSWEFYFPAAEELLARSEKSRLPLDL